MQLWIGALAVMLTVGGVVPLASVLSKAPILFLRLCEAQMGQVDAAIYPINGGSTALNYTLVTEVVNGLEDTRYIWNSPRYVITGNAVSGNRCAAQLDPWQVDWKYLGPSPNDTCLNQAPTQINLYDRECDMNTSVTIYPGSCFDFYCRQVSPSIALYIIDSEKEDRIGLGSEWKLPPMAPGCVYVFKDLADTLGVTVGDPLILILDEKKQFPSFWNATTARRGAIINTIYATFNVCGTYKSSGGKHPSTDVKNSIFVEYQYFTSYISNQVHPNITQSFKDMLNTMDLYESAQHVVFMLPPSQRNDIYVTSDYTKMVNDVYGEFISTLVYYVGFLKVSTDAPIMYAERNLEEISRFLSSVLWIVTSILLYLCVMVVYSLLSISIETKARMSSIMRMVGMDRIGLITGVLLQASSYVLPGWALGLILGQIIMYIAVTILYALSGIVLDPVISWFSFGLSLFVGFFIPSVASLLPISASMKRSIVEGLDIKTAGNPKVAEIQIERGDDGGIFSSRNLPWIATGLVVAVFGFMIYYFVPLSFLADDQGTLLMIFVILLLGMFFGLVLLSLSFELLLEKLLVTLLLWWESGVVRSILRKNISAHRRRNLKTSLLYSLSLALILFIIILLNTQFSLMINSNQSSYGSDLKVEGANGGYIDVNTMESFLVNNSDTVKHFAWLSLSNYWYRFIQGNSTDVSISTLGRFVSSSIEIFSVSPDFYESQFKNQLVISNPQDKGIEYIMDDLHSANGSGKLIIGTTYQETMGLNLKTPFLLGASNEEPRVMQPEAFVTTSSIFRFSNLPSVTSQSGLSSFTTYLRITNGQIRSVDDIAMRDVFIDLEEDATDIQLKCFKRKIQLQGSVTVKDYASSITAIVQAQTALNFFFDFALFVTMLICLTALISSMSINIFEQTKQTAILLSIGLTKFKVYRINIYEAFIVMVASSLNGIIIGSFVGWTIRLQKELLSQEPIPFTFPTGVLVVVTVICLVGSLLATYFPTRSLVNERPATLLQREV